MTDRRCTRRWEHDAVREGRLGAADGASFWRHVRTCTDCADDVARNERLRALGRTWGIEPPGELALRRVRARVLRDAANAPARVRFPGHRRVAVGFALAAALMGPVIFASLQGGRSPLTAPAPTASAQAPSPPIGAAFAGSVLAMAGSRWTQTRTENVERVLLETGTIAIHVRPQVAGERFLVELPDGELEVRGTTFEVAVEGDTTTRVHVDEGTVEIRLRGEPERAIVAGNTWSGSGPEVARADALRAGDARVARPAREVAAVAPAASDAAGAPRARSTAPAAPTPSIDAYSSAMSLLRAGRAEDAASAFHAFASAHPIAPQAEDASFLEALALARAGRRDAAGLAAEHHLASFPHSFHRKDAAILVARAATQRGDCAGARAVLAPWLRPEAGPASPRDRRRGVEIDSTDPDVASALRGCDTLPRTTGASPEKAEK